MTKMHGTSRIHGTKELWVEALRVEGPAFATAAATVDPSTPVPSRSGTSMGDLVHHLGSVYRYTGAHVVRGVTGRPERDLAAFAEEPRAEDLAGWWHEQYEKIMSTLEMLDPDAPAWNWAPQTKTAAFWQRRTAHETALHRWDAQMAAVQAEPVEERLAADGVSEVLDTWLPAGRRTGPIDVSGLVALEATDVAHTWRVRLRGAGVALLDTDTIFDDDAPDPRAAATGTASDILLALHGRVGLDVLDINGDEHLLRAVRVG